MTNVIIAFSKQDDAKNIKNILMRNGFQVSAVCISGAQTLARAGDLVNGIIVCGYRLSDMIYEEVCECMPSEFQMLLVASPGRQPEQPTDNLVYLSTPIKVHELISTLEMMSLAQMKKRRKKRQQTGRSDAEKALIFQAKKILMERNHMTEEEAHRYIQKCSMDSGTNMIETAQMVISLSNIGI